MAPSAVVCPLLADSDRRADMADTLAEYPLFEAKQTTKVAERASCPDLVVLMQAAPDRGPRRRQPCGPPRYNSKRYEERSVARIRAPWLQPLSLRRRGPVS